MERGVAFPRQWLATARRGGSAARSPATTTGVRGVHWDRSGASPVREKCPPGPKCHGGAPRGERLRETRAPHTRPGRAARHAPRVPQHPHVISALRHPSFRVREAKGKTRAQKTRRGNEETCAV